MHTEDTYDADGTDIDEYVDGATDVDDDGECAENGKYDNNNGESKDYSNNHRADEEIFEIEPKVYSTVETDDKKDHIGGTSSSRRRISCPMMVCFGSILIVTILNSGLPPPRATSPRHLHKLLMLSFVCLYGPCECRCTLCCACVLSGRMQCMYHT